MIGPRIADREPQLELFKQAIADSDRHHTLVIDHDATHGKTRLLHAFRAYCKLRSIPFGCADCDLKNAAEPHEVLYSLAQGLPREALATFMEHSRAISRAGTSVEVSRAVVFGALIHATGSGTSRATLGHLLDTFIEGSRGVANQTPCVVALDNCHRAVSTVRDWVVETLIPRLREIHGITTIVVEGDTAIKKSRHGPVVPVALPPVEKQAIIKYVEEWSISANLDVLSRLYDDFPDDQLIVFNVLKRYEQNGA